MTVCCQCGRHYWPGVGLCPGRPQRWVGPELTDASGCNHEPCEKCTHYVDEKEKGYGKTVQRTKRSASQGQTKRKQARKSSKA